MIKSPGNSSCPPGDLAYTSSGGAPQTALYVFTPPASWAAFQSPIKRVSALAASFRRALIRCDVSAACAGRGRTGPVVDRSHERRWRVERNFSSGDDHPASISYLDNAAPGKREGQTPRARRGGALWSRRRPSSSRSCRPTPRSPTSSWPRRFSLASSREWTGVALTLVRCGRWRGCRSGGCPRPARGPGRARRAAAGGADAEHGLRGWWRWQGKAVARCGAC